MGFTTGIIRKTYKAKVSSGRHVDQSLTFPWRGMPEPGHPARFTVAERSLLKVTLESILEDWGRVTGLHECQAVWLLYASEFQCLQEFPKKDNRVAPAKPGES